MTLRLLIVDDHPLTRDALASLLAQHGFDVVGQAADGTEAIRLAGELGPDVILLDLSMPGLEGLDALPRLCRTPHEQFDLLHGPSVDVAVLHQHLAKFDTARRAAVSRLTWRLR